MSMTLFHYQFIPPKDTLLKSRSVSIKIDQLKIRKKTDWLKISVFLLGILTFLSLGLLAYQFHNNSIKLLEISNEQSKAELARKLKAESTPIKSKTMVPVTSTSNYAPENNLINLSSIPVLPALNTISTSEATRTIVKRTEPSPIKTVEPQQKITLKVPETESIKRPIFKSKTTQIVESKTVESTKVKPKVDNPNDQPQSLF